MKGPGHDSKRCSESTKVKNALKMAIIDGIPNKLGERFASSVIKAKKASPKGTIRLAIPRTRTSLPITVGAAKTESTMKYTSEEIWDFQLKNNLHQKFCLIELWKCQPLTGINFVFF